MRLGARVGFRPVFRRLQLQHVEIDCVRRFDVHEVGDADLEGTGDGEEDVHRRVPSPAFDLGEVAKREADLVSSVRLGPALPPSRLLDADTNAPAEQLPAAPSGADVARMLANATPPWLVTAIFLAVYAGMRSGEVRAVRVGDIDFVCGVIHVRVAMSEDVATTPKSKHSIRDVPIAAPLLPVLRHACAGKLPLARVVTNGHGGTPSRTHLLTVFVALQKRLGMAKVWSFHSLRHYFCSTLVRRGVAISAVQALAGHASIDRYTHATREDVRAGIATFGK